MSKIESLLYDTNHRIDELRKAEKTRTLDVLCDIAEDYADWDCPLLLPCRSPEFAGAIESIMLKETERYFRSYRGLLDYEREIIIQDGLLNALRNGVNVEFIYLKEPGTRILELNLICKNFSLFKIREESAKRITGEPSVANYSFSTSDGKRWWQNGNHKASFNNPATVKVLNSIYDLFLNVSEKI